MLAMISIYTNSFTLLHKIIYKFIHTPTFTPTPPGESPYIVLWLRGIPSGFATHNKRESPSGCQSQACCGASTQIAGKRHVAAPCYYCPHPGQGYLPVRVVKQLSLLAPGRAGTFPATDATL